MDTKTKLENALRNAMHSRDEVSKRVIRLALSAIKLSEVEKGRPLDEAGVIAVLQKEVKAHHETIEEARRAGRQDMIDEAEAELAILKEFLPQPLSPDELACLVREVIAEVGATGPADMGKVMKVLTPRLQGRASGSEASQAVRQMLQQGVKES